MFGIGPSELLVILFVILLLFGAKKLPELAQSLGKSMNEFRKGMNSVTEELKKNTTPPANDNKPAVL